ncbi:acyl-CoA reductase [Paraburkholderia sediminicola]|uniref:acyl-CoA reductase n=1 Tax=Paraburkholderia sediminicola TaxID=458836 RepID=UPI0038B8A172
MSTSYNVPLIIRGKLIEGGELTFGGRRGGVSFTAPDITRHVDELTLRAPSQMADLYTLSLEQIVDYLVELGQHLNFADNRHLQQAFELSCATSGLSESILRFHYTRTPRLFQRDELYNIVARSVGAEYLEGWVEQPGSLPGVTARTRAFGARCVHVIAGNAPVVAVLTLIRNALTRSDAIIKAPSNDPLTSMALARTMIDMAPDHPLTKHLSVAYWKGGDETVERHIYDPRKVEKLIAWGGFDSVKHITRYLQPGLDLITLDPKLSGTIIGHEAFADEPTLTSVARRLALDIGAQNQEACVSARVIYVQSGTDEAGLARCARLAELTFAALQALPENLSTPHKAFDPQLKEELDGIRMIGDDYTVFGGRSNEGALIVSHDGAPVSFSRILGCRVGNLVPIDEIDTAVRSVNAYTQTIGIFPEALKHTLRDRLAYQGAQRLVSLGAAATLQHNLDRQDAIEPIRRTVKWVTEETADPVLVESLAG